ncbi:MAG: uracil permease, partial [Tissierellia bacterium]|nr:uracil permease [Tissierellia bacterium]
MAETNYIEPIRDARKQLSVGKTILLGLQHTFTMFGSTVLVPLLTGTSVSVALTMAGICTLLFHFITKFKMPVFLGSSFAFIGPTLAAAAAAGGGPEGLAYACGGIVAAGIIYAIVAFLIYQYGVEKVVSFFPPIITGPIIMVIGLTLAPTATSMAAENWFLAIVAFLVVVAVNIYARGFLQIVPVLCGLVVGYIVAVITGNVDFTPIAEAAWFGLPDFQLAKFDIKIIAMVAPVAVATIVEHIGDVIAIGATVEDDFLEEPGLHRTMLGDGIGTALSAMVGGPANTTYSENTGVLALTRVWDPLVMRIAAIFAIILGGVPKIAALVSTIPGSVIGGMSIVLFGMIAAVGVRTLVENQVDFKQPRNLLIAATILVLGLGGEVVPGGMALAAVIG